MIKFVNRFEISIILIVCQSVQKCYTEIPIDIKSTHKTPFI